MNPLENDRKTNYRKLIIDNPKTTIGKLIVDNIEKQCLLKPTFNMHLQMES